MVLNRLLSNALVAALFFPGILSAAEFTWFTGAEGREGWIEFSAETTAFQNRIHVFPRLGSPDDPADSPRVAARDDGAVVTLLIDAHAPSNATAFTHAVLARVVSQPGAVSSQYQINVPRPRSVRIDVLRDGEILASRSIDGQIGAAHTVQIKVPASGATKAGLLRGDFQVQASFELPTASFSSIGISVKESLVTRYKIEALKSVVTSSRTSGGKFLFLDWRRQSARAVINESINEQRSINATRQTSVLTIDPDEAMVARVEQLLGLAPLSRETFVTNHLRDAEQAEAAGNHELAALHREYAAKADDPTPKVQTELLEKVFAALGGSEPAISAFLANGIQFTEGVSGSSSRFQGFGQSRTDLFTSNGYSEMRLTTALVRYVLTVGPFAASEASIRDWFGTSTPNSESATRGLLRGIEVGNMPMVLAALRFNAGYNAVYGMKRETPLIMAAQRCNTAMVQALLDAGANPLMFDTSNRRAADHALLAGCPQLAELISSYQ